MRIEEGCLAMITGGVFGKYIGKTVTVGRFLGEVEGWGGSDRWKVDALLEGSHGGMASHRREKNLMRIDGLKEEQKDTIDMVKE